MPKLPHISGQRLLKYLQSLGYEVIRQKGSHVRLNKMTIFGEHAITVPLHYEIAKGTLNDILGQVSHWNNLGKDDIIRQLQRF